MELKDLNYNELRKKAAALGVTPRNIPKSQLIDKINTSIREGSGATEQDEFNGLSYRELQARAKSLNIKPLKVKRDVLLKKLRSHAATTVKEKPSIQEKVIEVDLGVYEKLLHEVDPDLRHAAMGIIPYIPDLRIRPESSAFLASFEEDSGIWDPWKRAYEERSSLMSVMETSHPEFGYLLEYVQSELITDPEPSLESVRGFVAFFTLLS